MPLCVSSPRHQKTNLIVLWVPPACGLGEGRGQAPHMGKLRPPHEEGHPQCCRKDGPGFSGPPTLLLRVTFLPWGSGDGSVQRLGGRNGGRGLWDWLSPLRRAVGGGSRLPVCLTGGGGDGLTQDVSLLSGWGIGKKKNPSLRKDNLVILEVWISGSSSARSTPPPPAPGQGRASAFSNPTFPWLLRTDLCRPPWGCRGLDAILTWVSREPVPERVQRSCGPPGSRGPSPPWSARCPSLKDLGQLHLRPDCPALTGHLISLPGGYVLAPSGTG